MIELKFKPFNYEEDTKYNAQIEARQGRRFFRVGSILKMKNGQLRLVGHVDEGARCGGQSNCVQPEDIAEIAYIDDLLGIPQGTATWSWRK